MGCRVTAGAQARIGRGYVDKGFGVLTMFLILVGLALVPLSALIWWLHIRAAVDASRPVGIYERIASLLERQVHPMEDDLRAAVAREVEKEFSIALHERGIDPVAYRLELRDDDLLDVAPWVVHANGREEPLSMFEATLMQASTRPKPRIAHDDPTNPYNPPRGDGA